MNYRHAYHAGNFADVHKHLALVAVLLHLRKKEKPFVVIDTHAGTGLYDLTATEASKTAEAATGVERLRGYTAQTPALQKYLEVATSFGDRCYPGSPVIAAKLLRAQDRLVAFEKHPKEFGALERSLFPFPNAAAHSGDGYSRLQSLLPPPERRGVVLIDPPYEANEEMHVLAYALTHALGRFATGIFIIWHPLNLASDVQALVGEIQSARPMKLLSLTVDVGVEDRSAAAQLHAAGLLVVNPPFGLDVEMAAAGAELLPLLRRGPGAQLAVAWLSPDGERVAVRGA